MKKEWKSPKIIIGKDATGDYYYKRGAIEREIWEEIEKGNNILISAPRRVGKTSVMKSIVGNPKEGYKLIFKNIQGVNTEEGFYKTIYSLILDCLSKFNNVTEFFTHYIKTHAITEIGTGSLKIGSQNLNYADEINKIIPKLDVNGESVVLFLDEVPEVIHTLYKKNKIDEAISILKNLRHWRQNDAYKKLQFVIAGSIGIHHVVNEVQGRLSDINDLKKIYYEPLDEIEYQNYIEWATKEATVKYTLELKKYLQEIIQYLAPYFINLMLDEVNMIALKNNNNAISEEIIDVAFKSIIKKSDHFSDWKKRLKDYLKPNDYSFVNEVLIHISHENSITVQQLYNKATKYQMTDDYMEFVNDLEHDGYITEQSQKYVFVSPFLKEYWKKMNPIYKK